MPNAAVSMPAGNGGLIGRCSTKCSFVTGSGSSRPGSACSAVIKVSALRPNIGFLLLGMTVERPETASSSLPRSSHSVYARSWTAAPHGVPAGCRPECRARVLHWLGPLEDDGILGRGLGRRGHAHTGSVITDVGFARRGLRAGAGGG